MKGGENGVNRWQKRHLKTLNPADVRKVRREALDENAQFQAKMLTASICLALHQEFGFGQERCLRVLDAVERISTNALTPSELIDQCKSEVRINLYDA